MRKYQCRVNGPDAFAREFQYCGLQPMNMLARLAGSVASAISSFTVNSMLTPLVNFRLTVLRDRSAASSTKPEGRSMPAKRKAASAYSDMGPAGWARSFLSLLGILRLQLATTWQHMTR